MTDLFWPGDERAGELMSDVALLTAIARVESAWLAALVSAGITAKDHGPDAADPADPADPADLTISPDLTSLLGPDDVPAVSAAAEAGGNPVIPALGLLRTRLAETDPDAARWLHRGLTSQDVLDTSIVLMLADVAERLISELSEQVRLLAALVRTHRETPMAGRTLTQHAVPITFGLKVAHWMTAVLDAADDLTRAAATMPAQFGGAAGTLAAVCELADGAGLVDPPQQAMHLVTHASKLLELQLTPPWHTSRAPFTRLGDVLVRSTDAWGRLALDVTTLSRPEIAEVHEGRDPAGTARGGSSTMPQKHNPILAVLIRRAALAAPPLGGLLHLAAADAGDERPAGAWHTEWATLRTLARRSVVAGSQTTELLRGLEVDAARMRATLDAAKPGILAEKASIASLLMEKKSSSDADSDNDPIRYLGATQLLIDAALVRADRFIEEHS